MRSSYFCGCIALVMACCVLSSSEMAQTRNEESFVSHGLTLHYTAIGHGSPVLLLPGGPGMDVAYLQPVAQLLAPTHTVILLDPRGTTGSLPGEFTAQTVSLALYIDDYEALRQHLGYGQWAVLGHSAGSYFAMRYGIAHPGSVSRLILAGAMGPTWASMGHFGDNISSRLTDAEGKQMAELDSKAGTDSVMAEQVRLIFPGAYFFDHKIGQAFGATMNPGNCHRKTHALLIGEMLNYDLRPALGQLQIPTLVLQGRQDPVDLEIADETRAAIPLARLAIIERAGHFSWLEQPEVFAQDVIDFLGH